jgi:hypothetical protein
MTTATPKYTCNDEMQVLLSINNNTKLIHDMMMGLHSAPGFNGNDSGWKFYHIGKSWFYEQVVTYPGAAVSVDLNLPKACQLNRIEQIWNDATAKDFSIRVFTDPSSSSYIELDTQTANTATSRLLQAGIEYKYPAGSRIRIYSGSNTATKTDTIRIQVDEL